MLQCVFFRPAAHCIGAVALTLLVAGCGAAGRISEIGQAPDLSPIENPTLQANYQPVALPMPAPEPIERQAASLWRPGSRAFFSRPARRPGRRYSHGADQHRRQCGAQQYHVTQ